LEHKHILTQIASRLRQISDIRLHRLPHLPQR